MKKKVLLSIIFVLVLIFGCTVSNAATKYETDTYELNIPGTYTMVENAGVIQLTNAQGVVVQIRAIESKNNELEVNEALLENQEDTLEQTYINGGYDAFERTSKSIVEKNGCKALKIDFKVTQSNVSVYMTAYYYVSDNYIHSIAVGGTNKSYVTAAENELVNTFKVKDTVLYSRGIPFTDVASNAWYQSAVKYNYENNMIKGLNAYTFGPSKNLTRGMLVTILHRMEGSPSVSGASKFTDVQNTKDYYYTAVKWATKNNIISGYNSGKFGPNDPITREQLAVILSKYSKFKGKYKASTASLSSFKDGGKVSTFAQTGMQWAVGNGVITGNASSKTLNPQGTTTRAEAASMLYKYCSNVK